MILSLIVFLPLAGALLVLLAGGSGDRSDRDGLVRMLALGVSLVTFTATLASCGGCSIRPAPTTSSSSVTRGCRPSAFSI